MCYALGGIVVIVDAGGCAGNICGFDEPRWQPDYEQTLTALVSGQKDASPDGASSQRRPVRVGAVFSAGLRDMDAILGRDEALVAKLEEACRTIHASFIALVGTPVPAVIGTDLLAGARMAERSASLPCIAIPTDGMHLYDRGIEETLLALVKAFSTDDRTGLHPPSGEHRISCVLGLNPLDLFDPEWTVSIRGALLEKGYYEVLLPGMEGGLEAVIRCPEAAKNYVVSPAGIAAARYLEQKFGIPYEITFPADPFLVLEKDPLRVIGALSPDARILVVHQQVLANAIRSALRERGMKGFIQAATWFDLKESIAIEGDLQLREEEDFIDLVREGEFDLIIADPALKPMADSYEGAWIDAFHFAVSGQAAIDQRRMRLRKDEGCRT